jgi:hypothetical protein
MSDNKDGKQQENNDFNKELEDLEDAALGAFAVPKNLQERINKQKTTTSEPNNVDQQ